MRKLPIGIHTFSEIREEEYTLRFSGAQALLGHRGREPLLRTEEAELQQIRAPKPELWSQEQKPEEVCHRSVKNV
ncbi:MAG: hypothetical protein D3925_13490 [Candidatus Electrothrix sp. AR5]|nr:hypothetical protein [Candidatus Electrothrix sp. AR5]